MSPKSPHRPVAPSPWPTRQCAEIPHWSPLCLGICGDPYDPQKTPLCGGGDLVDIKFTWLGQKLAPAQNLFFPSRIPPPHPFALPPPEWISSDFEQVGRLSTQSHIPPPPPFRPPPPEWISSDFEQVGRLSKQWPSHGKVSRPTCSKYLFSLPPPSFPPPPLARVILSRWVGSQNSGRGCDHPASPYHRFSSAPLTTESGVLDGLDWPLKWEQPIATAGLAVGWAAGC